MPARASRWNSVNVPVGAHVYVPLDIVKAGFSLQSLVKNEAGALQRRGCEFL